ncbi:S41 family peptidase [Conexibacter sp. SYSU D00693]|uniref:S41 family peptidase n=1 Tax=Conexibacter sp. SYSU D00693 TaxID=2812560 RepID=UPI00196AC4BE|nr:S41 family peptidase [Conexibacter sp. SYSU D00693]
MRPRFLLAILMVPALLAAGIFLGGHPDALPGFVRDGLVGDKDTRVVKEAIDTVAERYYRGLGDEELADRAIAGMVESLDDPFSSYFDPKEYARFEQAQSSEFSGVGLTVSEDPGGLRVVDVFDDSPAKRAGIASGDVIVAAGGKRLKGLSQSQAVARIKGPEGTDVRLRIKPRKGRERDVRVTRATISVPVVASRVRSSGGKRLGVVKLAQFTSGAHAEVNAAIRKLEARKVEGLVLDLRGNGGGLVSEAQLIASAFLKGGAIVTTKGRSLPSRTLKATGDPIAGDLPMVVLVDRDSASASEIVAGALQDRKRAALVGTRTYGKGVFQQVIELSNGGALDITAGQYFTPAGRNLGGKGTAQGRGLAPDVSARDDRDTPDVDEGLDRALEVLAERAA